MVMLVNLVHPPSGLPVGGQCLVVRPEQYVLNQTLVDAHLVEIPGLGTLTARGLTGGDLEVLGGQADGALDAQVLALGALDELGADLLEGLDLAGGQGDTDLVGLLQRVISKVWRRRQGMKKGRKNVREPQNLPCRPFGKTS